jgi:hypothetical protein
VRVVFASACAPTDPRPQPPYAASDPPRPRRRAAPPLPPLPTPTHVPAGSDPETIDTGTIPARYDAITTNKQLLLAGTHRIAYDADRDMLWRWDRVLRTHPNGMRFSAFCARGDMLATNEYFRCIFLPTPRPLLA